MIVHLNQTNTRTKITKGHESAQFCQVQKQKTENNHPPPKVRTPAAKPASEGEGPGGPSYGGGSGAGRGLCSTLGVALLGGAPGRAEGLVGDPDCAWLAGGVGCAWLAGVRYAENGVRFYGVQFHPERSGDAGAQLLENFVSL